MSADPEAVDATFASVQAEARGDRVHVTLVFDVEPWAGDGGDEWEVERAVKWACRMFQDAQRKAARLAERKVMEGTE